jgi:hypothetical protein
MTAQSQLDQYLESFRHRLQRLVVARAAAIVGVTALLVTLVAVYFGMRRAFAPGFVIGARTVLLVAIAAVIVALLIVPLRKIRATRAISDIERRAPEFDGRLETYDGMKRTTARSPFLGLLAEDALAFARRIPITLRVPPMHINAPLAVAVLAGLLLVGVGSVGPDNWRYGVRHLWAGWLFDNTLPPQRIVVEPGDGTVRRGGDLTVLAHAEGFEPPAITLYAQLQPGASWQSTLMERGAEESFEFKFFAVREPMRYYVEAAGIRSPEFVVDVVDLPEITGIKLTYNYPEWTRLEPRTEDPGTDIFAVAGTEVTVQIETDRPLPSARLAAYGQPIDMAVEGNLSTATLAVNEEGEYFISTLFGGDDVRLSDDYFISIDSDDEPEVRVIKPGRDWRASNIEEVSVQVEAKDDFGLDSLELRYSVNGGEWQTVALPGTGTAVEASEILYLEEMRQPERAQRTSRRIGEPGMPLTLENLRALRAEREAQARADEEAEAQPEAVAAEPAPAVLQPGDLISYYVVAKDREQKVETDLFFIEVQPFGSHRPQQAVAAAVAAAANSRTRSRRARRKFSLRRGTSFVSARTMRVTSTNSSCRTMLSCSRIYSVRSPTRRARSQVARALVSSRVPTTALHSSSKISRRQPRP